MAVDISEAQMQEAARQADTLWLFKEYSLSMRAFAKHVAAQVLRPIRYTSGGPGEVLGGGNPDWPADLQTFAERRAYQRGVADARRMAAGEDST